MKNTDNFPWSNFLIKSWRSLSGQCGAVQVRYCTPPEVRYRRMKMVPTVVMQGGGLGIPPLSPLLLNASSAFHRSFLDWSIVTRPVPLQAAGWQKKKKKKKSSRILLGVIAYLFFIFLNNDFYFFHYSWFTVFCQFSTAQQVIAYNLCVISRWTYSLVYFWYPLSVLFCSCLAGILPVPISFHYMWRQRTGCSVSGNLLSFWFNCHHIPLRRLENQELTSRWTHSSP